VTLQFYGAASVTDRRHLATTAHSLEKVAHSSSMCLLSQCCGSVKDAMFELSRSQLLTVHTFVCGFTKDVQRACVDLCHSAHCHCQVVCTIFPAASFFHVQADSTLRHRGSLCRRSAILTSGVCKCIYFKQGAVIGLTHVVAATQWSLVVSHMA
jgi:hypothetical protein